MIVISAAGGAVFLGADAVADARPSVGHGGKPGEELFLALGAEIKMTGFWTPRADIARQFDVDRYLLDGCRDVVAMEIVDKAVGPDADVATGLRCLEQLRRGVEKLHEGAAVRQGNVDGDPWREWTVRADIGLSEENHDNGRTIVEMGIEVPPFVAAPFRADALTVLKLRYFSGDDAKFLVIGGKIRQPKVTILAAMHGYSLLSAALEHLRVAWADTGFSSLALSSRLKTETQRSETGFADRIKVHRRIDEQLHGKA